MKNRSLIVGLLLVACSGKAINAQGFAIPDRRYQSSYVPAAARPARPAVAPASYWVERDPRYHAGVGNVRPVGYANTSYRPYYSDHDCRGPANYPPTLAQPRAPYRAPLPKGYYKTDGLFGKDTVFAENQPVRNLFRFLFP